MKTLVFSFGRMNPVTSGHELLVKKVIAVARKEGADAKIYLSHTTDSNKNPLSYSDKIKFAQKSFGKIIQKSNSKQIFQILKEIDKDYDSIIMVVGDDRIDEFNNTINKYNGKGDYDFESIKVVSSGNRVDPDSEKAKKQKGKKKVDAKAMSASLLRKYAIEGDFDTFKKGVPSKLPETDAKAMYDAVRRGLGIREEEIDEVLNMQQRLAKSRQMKKLASKIAMGRKRAMKRKAGMEALKKRAEKKARNMVRSKFAGKMGANYNELSYKSKEAVDKKVATKKGLIKKLTQRLIPQVKKAETERFKKMNEDFEEFIINMDIENLFEASVRQDKDIKDKEGSQPAKYYAGDMSKSTKDKRAAHFNKGKKMDDDNPDAYKPAPGDKSAKTKESQYTKKYKKMYGEEKVKTIKVGEDAVGAENPHYGLVIKREVVATGTKEEMISACKEQGGRVWITNKNVGDIVEEKELQEEIKGLKKKADESGISYAILKKVYDRGVAAWRTGHRPGTTPQQWGFARVNSFIVGGKTRTTADADLWKKHKG